MQKVISINLNGNAYQLDEGGYETLHEYLARAERQLETNPDRAEIVTDLEQAIADKCQRYLAPHKTVVTAAEIEQIIADMGPVDSGTGETAAAGAPAVSQAGTKGDTHEGAPKRLYRIPSGAVIAGVCTGLAAYVHVDVAIVRIAFVVATLLTKGAAIIAYVVMMFVIPEASTAEERAAAGGLPFNAKEVIDRARRRSAETSRQLRRQFRRQRREWRRYGWPGAAAAGYAPPSYAPPPGALLLLPVFGLAHMALFLLALAMLISLVNTGGILNWQLPPDVPVWAGALILFLSYQIVVSPLRAARHWGYGAQVGPFAFWDAVIWLLGLAVAIWLASNHVPEIREFLQRVPGLFREFIGAMRELFARAR